MMIGQTEQKIRHAAITLIARDGYQAMSLRQLASEAGVNSSTLYLYYQGKRDLLLALVLEYFQQLNLGWETCRRPRAKATTQLQLFVTTHIRHHLLCRDHAVLGNMELRSLDDDERELVRKARRAYRQTLQSILEKGLREGSLHCDNPALSARIVLNMLSHACVWFRETGPLNVEEVVAHYAELVLRMLGGEVPRRVVPRLPGKRAASKAVKPSPLATVHSAYPRTPLARRGEA